MKPRSLLVLHCVLTELVLHPDASVSWIDTEGEFDAHRCLAITMLLLEDLRQVGIQVVDSEGRFDDDAKALDVLNRLAVSKTLDGGVALDAIVNDLKGDGERRKTRMVVIDSAVPLLGGDALMSASARGQRSPFFFSQCEMVDCKLITQ